ncbi:MAG: DUF1993 domain-containing protein [Rhizobiales bacterium]|nr:DUF1993 domain-containing protein [Hyphomicrobiales bacterium]MBI3674689.1 DUF1993 domain-containing protein [Hyphomicrobiales bacterium]
MFDSSVPVFTRYLNNFAVILKKAEEHCAARKIDPNALLNFRLFPDMLPFTRQVLIACDHAKGASARLAGMVPPSYEDNEKTFAELQARIAKTLAFIATLKPELYKDAEKRTITLKVAGTEMSWLAVPYLMNFVMPNFHFHLTTAYNILRHNGVELGKFDYIGRN